MLITPATPATVAGSPGEDGLMIMYSYLTLDEDRDVDDETETFLEEQFMHDEDFLSDPLVREMGEVEPLERYE